MRGLIFALAVACVSVPAMAADTVTYNSTPTDGWYYGTGNDYAPANTAVLRTDAGDELYLRMHETFEVAPASDGSGVYSFALGTDPMSFDWGIDNTLASPISALLTLTNIGTGTTFSYDPFFIGNDNEVQSGSTQNSFRLNWAPIGYNANIDNTYRVDLSVSGLANSQTNRSLSVFAKLGEGASAVPEPATWAIMLLGFFGIGFTMRRKGSMTGMLPQTA